MNLKQKRFKMTLEDFESVASVLLSAVNRHIQQPACKCSDKGKWIELIQNLFKSHVCSRCILRVLGNKSAADYSLPGHDTSLPSQIVLELKKIASDGEFIAQEAASVDGELSRIVDEGPCSLCLGLLQHLMATEDSPPLHLQRNYALQRVTARILQEVMSLIKADDERAAFSVHVSDQSPLLILRQRLLSDHLAISYKWALKGRGLDDAVSITSVLRAILFPEAPQPRSQQDVDDVKLVVSNAGNELHEELRPLFQDYCNFKRKKPTNAPEESDFTAFCRDQAASHIASVPGHILKKIYQPLWHPTRSSHSSSQSYEVRIIRPPVYLAGRYLKLKRYMPQSKWFDPATGHRIGDVSLAERLEAAILSAYKGDECKFIAGGREDADVRMLGEGRPFVMEISNPEAGHPSSERLRQIEESLSAADHGARAVGLTPCNRKALEKLKSVEESKEKTYLALCWSERLLDQESIDRLQRIGGGQGIEVMQDTPLRVLHRRASKIRPRKVWLETIDPIPSNPQYFNLRLRTQAGTYVKEFCHGDLGRSQPNLGSLLDCRTEILQLDVLAVHMGNGPDAEQWP